MAMEAVTILTWLVYAGLAAVAGVLVLGVVAMLRGGDLNRRYGNILMRWRVGLQGAVVILLLLLWLLNRG
jgi:hypothetical protein